MLVGSVLHSAQEVARQSSHAVGDQRAVATVLLSTNEGAGNRTESTSRMWVRITARPLSPRALLASDALEVYH